MEFNSIQKLGPLTPNQGESAVNRAASGNRLSASENRAQAPSGQWRSQPVLDLGRWDRYRKFKSTFAHALLLMATVIAVLPLMSVLFYVISQGLSGLSASFFLELPRPIGEAGGGLGHALLGSLLLVSAAVVIGVPVSLISGVYLSEFGRDRFSLLVERSIELLAGVPSIVLGIFAYAVIVVPMGGFSALAGSVALAVILIPTVSKSTQEVLKLVPAAVREAGLALGLPRWRVILQIVLWGSRSGLATGVMLAVARISGETAPLLFTALNAQFWPKGLLQPVASLPVQIYNYAISPFEEWTQLAWTGAMVLVFFVLIANLLVRWVLRRREV